MPDKVMEELLHFHLSMAREEQAKALRGMCLIAKQPSQKSLLIPPFP